MNCWTYFSEQEGTLLLEILSNQHAKWGFKVRGDVVLNGVPTECGSGLHDRVAYVQQGSAWCPDMTVRQTMLFTALLQAPGHPNRNFDTRGRIDALINDLGLNPVRHTRLAKVTVSEKRRLNVACQLLLDTDVVLLDQPTKGMDIFDTVGSSFCFNYFYYLALALKNSVLACTRNTLLLHAIILVQFRRALYFSEIFGILISFEWNIL